MQKLMLTVAAVLFGLSTVADELPVTDGLTVWLDASDEANVVLNEDGQVTTWINRASNGLDFTSANKYGGYVAPMYSRSGLAGKNVVMFGVSPTGEKNAYTMLATASKLKSQTIFIVSAILSEQWTKQGVAYGKKGGSYASDGLSRDYTMKYLRWIKDGFGGQGWLNGKKWLDEANGLGVASTYATPTTGAAHLITSVRKTAWDALMAVGEGNTGQHYDWYGPIGEIVVFDRQLPAYERVKVENYLLSKWVGATTRTWTGGTGDWSDGTKWDPAGVPESTDLVDIPVGGDVTVSDKSAVAAALTVEGSLTLAKDSKLSIARGGLGGNASLALKDGSWLAVNEDFSGASSGTQLLTYEGTVIIGQSSYSGTFKMPAVVHAGTRLVKRGCGRLVFTADGPTSGGYDIQCGTSAIDFAGTHQKFTSLTGSTFATNLVAGTLAQLEMDVADEGALDMQLPAELELTKKGAGVLTASGGSLVNTGKTEVAAGTLKAADAALPRTIPGLVVHIDASDPSTYDLTDDGLQTTAVRSKTGYGLSAGFRDDGGRWTWPYLAPNAINGRPAFAFGLAAKPLAAADKTSYLSFSAGARTVVAVAVTTNDIAYSAVPSLIGVWASQVKAVAISGRDWKWDLVQFAAYGENLAHGLCSVNGQVYYDYDNGLTETLHVTANVNNPQVLFMTASDSYGLPEHSIGINVTGTNRRWNGYLGELMLFNRVLSTADRQRLENYLMKKWGVTPAVTNATADTLSPSAPVAFAKGTTLDLNGLTQTVEKVVAEGAFSVTNGTLAAETLEVACAAGGTWGAIGGDANWDVTGTTLCLSGLGEGVKPAHGKLVTTTGACVGPFAAVDGFNPKEIKVAAHYIRLGLPGILLFVR